MRHALTRGMPHPYPPRWSEFPYVGKYDYSLTFVTDARRSVFEDPDAVDLVHRQILRAAAEQSFALTTYCYMPDHLHLVITGQDKDADCRQFIAAAKQYSGYYYSQEIGGRLWERYSYERVMRDAMELAMAIRYVVSNPVLSGLAAHPREYPFLGSSIYTVDELLEWCEYTAAEG